jgi:uncharacterized protein YcbK (DUF882 family)
MKRTLLTLALVAAFALGFSLSAAQPATSNFAVGQIQFNGADQAAADAKRDAALLDFARYQGLDIYTRDAQGNPTTTVDPAKVQPAVRQKFRDFFRDSVKAYRAQQAGDAARKSEEGKAVDN